MPLESAANMPPANRLVRAMANDLGGMTFAWRPTMKKQLVTASSVLVAGAIAVALILRPSRTITPELPPPGNVPAELRGVIKKRMSRHGAQVNDLITRVVALDFDGSARAAGAIYDEPMLARPIGGDELNNLLPETFFALQDKLHLQSKRVVEAAAHRDAADLADAFGALARTCVSCHDLYLHGTAGAPNVARPPL
jgi:hypothetical protein